jgi:hypothetical protein
MDTRGEMEKRTFKKHLDVISISSHDKKFKIRYMKKHRGMTFAKRPTNAQGSNGCFINTFQILYPYMCRHMFAILRGW